MWLDLIVKVMRTPREKLFGFAGSKFHRRSLFFVFLTDDSRFFLFHVRARRLWKRMCYVYKPRGNICRIE